MPTSFVQYEMLPTTWFYVSAIIIISTFFRFDRLWCVRNLDICGILLLTPGLLLLAMRNSTGNGYTWLFVIQILLAVRLTFDIVMVRRPLLYPNLSAGGLTFSCIFLLFFLVAALVVNRGDQLDTIRTVRLEQILAARHVQSKFGMNPETLTIPAEAWNNFPPGFRPFLALTERADLMFAPSGKLREEIVQNKIVQNKGDTPSTAPLLPPGKTPEIIRSNDMTLTAFPVPTLAEQESAAQYPALREYLFTILLIIAGQGGIIAALIYIGYRHFGSFQTGISCAVLYLLHPYSNQMLARMDHVIPAALILGSLALYRHPFFSGFGIASAAALIFYPLCLIPLWGSFYRKKGFRRFLTGILSAFALFAILLFFAPAQYGTYWEQFVHMAGKNMFILYGQPEGFWVAEDMYFRMPVMAVFGCLCFGLFAVPAQKNFAVLLAGSALLMIGVQFWQIYQGGLYMAWYLPLLILAVFRPNLEDRTARSSVV